MGLYVSPCYTYGLDWIMLGVRKVPLDVARKVRGQLSHEDRVYIKERLKEKFLLNAKGMDHGSVDGWQLHHIVPISVGGNNSPQNLVLTEPNLHHAIHEDLLDPQLEGMRIGDRAVIKVPVPRNKVFFFRGFPEYGTVQFNREPAPTRPPTYPLQHPRLPGASRTA